MFYAKQVLIYNNGVEISSFHQFNSIKRRNQFVERESTSSAQSNQKRTYKADKVVREAITKEQMLEEIDDSKLVKHSYIEDYNTDPNKKLILRVEDNKTFSSMADALTSVGLDKRNTKVLSKILKNKEDREYHGYHWKYI